MTEVGRARAPWPLRALGCMLLVLATLFYLQFAASALFNSVPQGVLVLVGTVGLGWAALRVARGEPAAGIVSIATMPLLLFHIVATLVVPDESPIFILLAGVAPVVAGLIWLVRRQRSGARAATSES